MPFFHSEDACVLRLEPVRSLWKSISSSSLYYKRDLSLYMMCTSNWAIPVYVGTKECKVAGGPSTVLYYINQQRGSRIVTQKHAKVQIHTFGTPNSFSTEKPVNCSFHYTWNEIIQNMANRYPRRREEECPCSWPFLTVTIWENQRIQLTATWRSVW